jgi:hypothetical protein
MKSELTLLGMRPSPRCVSLPTNAALHMHRSSRSAAAYLGDSPTGQPVGAPEALDELTAGLHVGVAEH